MEMLVFAVFFIYRVLTDNGLIKMREVYIQLYIYRVYGVSTVYKQVHVMIIDYMLHKHKLHSTQTQYNFPGIVLERGDLPENPERKGKGDISNIEIFMLFHFFFNLKFDFKYEVFFFHAVQGQMLDITLVVVQILSTCLIFVYKLCIRAGRY